MPPIAGRTFDSTDVDRAAVVTSAFATDRLGGVRAALGKRLDAEDEALVDSLVRPGHPSTPGFNDPAYPLTGRPVKA